MISCNSGATEEQFRVFRFNSSNGISSLDPAFARTQENIRAVNQLFNGLVQLDQELNIAPAIAKKWEISEDGKLYTFTLRNDVLFHKHKLFKSESERILTAYDVQYSLRRIIDPQVASDGAWIFNGIVNDSSAFRALNDTMFQIELNHAFAPMINMLSMAYCFIVPEKIVEVEQQKFGKTPVGTGPFVFANWAEGVKLNMQRNPDYFEATAEHDIPFIDGISITFVQSKQTALLQMLQGQLDAFTGLESSFKDEILDAEGKLNAKYTKDHQLIKSPFLNTEYLAFNMESDLFKDSILRQVINLAINKQDMITYLRNNVGIPAYGGFSPKGLPGHLENVGVNFDPERAKQLVEQLPEASRSFTLTTTKDYLDLCILVQRDLAEVGLNVEIDPVPSSLLKQQKSAGEVNFFRSSWIADYPDGENYMACFYSKNKAPNGPNYTRYSNAEFDALYEALITTSTPSERNKLLLQMETLLAKDLPFVLLFYDESIWITPKLVQGLKINPLNHLDLREVKINAE